MLDKASQLVDMYSKLEPSHQQAVWQNIRQQCGSVLTTHMLNAVTEEGFMHSMTANHCGASRIMLRSLPNDRKKEFLAAFQSLPEHAQQHVRDVEARADMTWGPLSMLVHLEEMADDPDMKKHMEALEDIWLECWHDNPSHDDPSYGLELYMVLPSEDAKDKFTALYMTLPVALREWMLDQFKTMPKPHFATRALTAALEKWGVVREWGDVLQQLIDLHVSAGVGDVALPYDKNASSSAGADSSSPDCGSSSAGGGSGRRDVYVCSFCGTKRPPNKCQPPCTARYCDASCQKQHWPEHKKECLYQKQSKRSS